MTATTATHDDTNDTLRKAAAALSEGGLVAFPTETVYGVAASAVSRQGYDALRRFKDVPDGQAFTVHLANPSEVTRWTPVVGGQLRRFIEKVWPGPVSLVVDVDQVKISDMLRGIGVPPEVMPRVIQNGAVSLRCPDHPLARQFIASAGGPVIASAANRPGASPALEAGEAAAALGSGAVVIDGGRCRYGKPSTVVRVRGTGARPTISVERAGVYDERYVMKLTRWTLLMICSGNTCRSPMAEGLARQIIARSEGLPESELEAAGLRVISAGAFASQGMPVSPEAVDVMNRRGIDISRHRSRPLTREMVHEADLILCMTESHLRAVVAMAPSAAEKTLALDPAGDIEDPIGSGMEAYERCAAAIEKSLNQRLKEYQP
ncbi:MAG: Sua5/YciO/YrdC/YwlC family protein [Planctomycetes bacterium]|nr:Sua5/YciO/YrdC/YwlC family protein [Planctomycetota bacterium]